MEFKKLKFSEADKKEMAALLKEYENIDLEKKEMTEIYAGDGCGGVCRYTCSTVCGGTCEINCTGSCDTRCTGTLKMFSCDLCAVVNFPQWP